MEMFALCPINHRSLPRTTRPVGRDVIPLHSCVNAVQEKAAFNLNFNISSRCHFDTTANLHLNMVDSVLLPADWFIRICTRRSLSQNTPPILPRLSRGNERVCVRRKWTMAAERKRADNQAVMTTDVAQYFRNH